MFHVFVWVHELVLGQDQGATNLLGIMGIDNRCGVANRGDDNGGDDNGGVDNGGDDNGCADHDYQVYMIILFIYTKSTDAHPYGRWNVNGE